MNLAVLAILLDRKSCAALGATRPYDCASSARLHAYQKTVSALSLGYGWLVCAFHVFSLASRKTRYYKVLRLVCQAKFTFLPVDKFLLAM